MGVAQLLEDDFDELSHDEIKDMVKIIRSSSANIYALLDDLLTWAQTQTDRMEYNYKNINLKEKSEKVINLLGVNSSKKQLSIQNKIPENCIAFADSISTETVLRNNNF